MAHSPKLVTRLLCLAAWISVAGAPAMGGEKVPGLPEIPNVDARDTRRFDADLKDFRPDMQVYSDGKGHYLVEAANFSLVVEARRRYLPNRFFWGSASSLRQLSEVGFAQREQDAYEVRFEEPGLGTGHPEPRIEVDTRSGQLNLRCGPGQARFSRLDDRSADAIRLKAAFVPLPPVRHPEYLYRIGKPGPDARMMYVDSSRYNPGFETFRVFVGPVGRMRQRRIARIAVREDDQTVLITTTRHELVRLPISPADAAKAVWQGTRNLEPLDLATFNLKELGIAQVPERSPAALSTPCEVLTSSK